MTRTPKKRMSRRITNREVRERWRTMLDPDSDQYDPDAVREGMILSYDRQRGGLRKVLHEVEEPHGLRLDAFPEGPLRNAFEESVRRELGYAKFVATLLKDEDVARALRASTLDKALDAYDRGYST